DMVQETGGIVRDICRSDYSQVLDQISQNVSKKINAKFELAFPAELEGLELRIDGKPVSSYNVNGKILTIMDPLSDKNGSLEVHYKHSPIAMRKVFDLNHASDPATFQVLVNDKALTRDDFQYDQMTGRIELKDMPPERAQVRVRYRE